MDKQKEALGLVKELYEEKSKELRHEMEEKMAKKLDDERKAYEALDQARQDEIKSLQGKVQKLKTQSAGEIEVLYKGYNPEHSKNFRGCLKQGEAEVVAEGFLKGMKAAAGGATTEIKAYFDADNAIPVGYSNTLLGLSELNSVAMSTFKVVNIEQPTLNIPVKGARAANTNAVAVDGTANAEETTLALEKLTFTIDTYVGSYINVLKGDIADATIPLVNNFILPGLAENHGQYIDAEAFLRTNSIFTSAVLNGPTSVSFTGAVNMSSNNPCTYENLLTMYQSLSWARNIRRPMWFGNQVAYTYVLAMKGAATGNDHPIFYKDLAKAPGKTLFGVPFVTVPVMDSAPASGGAGMFLAFGDADQYMICHRGAVETFFNPYILGKEKAIQISLDMRADGNIIDNATPGSSEAWTKMVRT